MPAAASVGRGNTVSRIDAQIVEMLGAQSLPCALNGDPFDVRREHDSRPCAEELQTDSSGASKLERKHS